MLLSKDDPFGMVVVEALQHGVPCILSKGVGAGRHLKEGIITFNGKFDTSFLTDLRFFFSSLNSCISVSGLKSMADKLTRLNP